MLKSANAYLKVIFSFLMPNIVTLKDLQKEYRDQRFKKLIMPYKNTICTSDNLTDAVNLLSDDRPGDKQLWS